MTYRKWDEYIWVTTGNLREEHNDTVDAWQAAEAEAERLGRANSDLCDQIEARAVGWELDVTADEAWAAYNAYGPGGIKAVLDLCRARIKPVFECKECAKWEQAYKNRIDERDTAQRRAMELQIQVNAVRAALEGE